MNGLDGQNGFTALILAAKHGHSGCVRLLVDAGANLDAEAIVRVGESACV
jgi:ankyrin repeat protein